jgi:hypothetical protein
MFYVQDKILLNEIELSKNLLHGLVEIVSEAFTQITELFNCDIILFSVVIKMYALICNLC